MTAFKGVRNSWLMADRNALLWRLAASSSTFFTRNSSSNRAFTIAMHERGPVQINIPRDYYYGEGDYEIQAPQKIERGAGGPESLDAAARLLAKAKFPVILSGGGVVMANQLYSQGPKDGTVIGVPINGLPTAAGSV